MIKDGRFGPYVTDGETNVTVPKGRTVEEIDHETAVEMLAIKRAKGPAPKRTTKKTTTKKTTTKTTSQKTSTNKAKTTKQTS